MFLINQKRKLHKDKIAVVYAAGEIGSGEDEKTVSDQKPHRAIRKPAPTVL